MQADCSDDSEDPTEVLCFKGLFRCVLAAEMLDIIPSVVLEFIQVLGPAGFWLALQKESRRKAQIII